MNARKEANSRPSHVVEESNGLTLVQSTDTVISVETEANSENVEIQTPSVTMGIAVGSGYGSTAGYASTSRQKGGVVISQSKRKRKVLIFAGPDDDEANSYASSLSENYDVSITSKVVDCDRLLAAERPEVLFCFVRELDERESMEYLKYVTDQKENNSLLVLAASRYSRLEERLQFYWAGIDTHILLPSTMTEIDHIIEGWEV